MSQDLQEFYQLAPVMVTQIAVLNCVANVAKNTILEREKVRYHSYTYKRSNDAPIYLIVEANYNQGPSLNLVTDRLAAPLVFGGEDYGVTIKRPEDVIWYEQSRNGQIEKVRFVTPTFEEHLARGWKTLPIRERVSMEQVMLEIYRPLVPNVEQSLQVLRAEGFQQQIFTNERGQTQQIADDYRNKNNIKF